MKNVTNSFSLFMTETSETGKAYMDMVMKQSKANALDKKTHEWEVWDYEGRSLKMYKTS